MFRYGAEYTPAAIPELIEGDVFKTIVPLRRVNVAIIAPETTWLAIKIKWGERLGVKLGVNEWRILEILWQNPSTTISELAGNIGISITAVENNIVKLKDRQLLESVGPDKTGHWSVIVGDSSNQTEAVTRVSSK